MYVCVRACVHVCAYICVCTHVCVRMLYTFICESHMNSVFLLLNSCCLCVRRTCTHTHTYVHTHTHTHTYIHTHTVLAINEIHAQKQLSTLVCALGNKSVNIARVKDKLTHYQKVCVYVYLFVCCLSSFVRVSPLIRSVSFI